MFITTIDIFCHVVDNFGDIGVVCRFAKEFKRAHPQCRVRVFVDDLNALHCIHPLIDTRTALQEHVGIVYIDSRALNEAMVDELGTAQALVEGFACYIPEVILDAASKRRTYIINLEHLSAEKWVEGYHLKESLVGRGGLKKYFFMPGFTIDTGGVIIDTHVESLRESVKFDRLHRLKDFFEPMGLEIGNESEAIVGTIFTYEMRFDSLIEALLRSLKHVFLLVFDGKSIKGMKESIQQRRIEKLGESLFRVENIFICYMPFLSQEKYDELLCLSDFNLVRGEDSWVRAILAEKPFIWHAYKQDNNYQMVKAKAFLETFGPYFEDPEIYHQYYEIFMQFNDSSNDIRKKGEYDGFIKELNKIGHATKKMSYFIRDNCNLVKKFGEFLLQLP
jgi:uncharacterized repeat protein (TIGR03837 family)